MKRKHNLFLFVVIRNAYMCRYIEMICKQDVSTLYRGIVMTSTELCDKINSYLLDNNCHAIEYIFSTYVTDTDREVISKVIIKYLENTLIVKFTDELLNTEDIKTSLLSICTDDNKMRYLCTVVHDATVALEKSKQALIYTSDPNICNMSSSQDSQQDKKINNNVLFISTVVIGMIIVIMIFSYIFCVTFFADFIKQENVRFVDQTLGNFNAILQTVIVFFFNGNWRYGSSGQQNTQKPLSNLQSETTSTTTSVATK